MAEWLKARAWKVRIPQKGIVGSNPAFSALAQLKTECFEQHSVFYYTTMSSL